MAHLFRVSLSLSLLLLWGASTATATQSNPALGQEGVVYRTVAGPQEELFPGVEFQNVAQATTAVLALDIVATEGTVDRLLVPGTDDLVGDIEQPASLLFDEGSGTLYLVWEIRRNGIHPLLNLVSFDGSQWGEPVTISTSAFALKGTPQLAITRDDFELPDSSNTAGIRVVQRAILHVVWWEDQAGGSAVLYAPVVLVDGDYGGQETPIFRMDTTQWVASEAPPGLADSLVQHPTITVGREHRSIVIGFGNQQVGEFVSTEVTVLPGEISRLGDIIRGHIIDAAFTGQDIEAWADIIRGHIIDANARMNPGNISILADIIRGHIIDARSQFEGNDPITVAGLIRGHIIDASVTLFGPEDMRLYAGAGHVVEEVSSEFVDAVGNTLELSHHLVFQNVSRRPGPPVEGIVTQVYLSSDGRDATVTWEEEGYLAYIESQGDGWAPIHRLPLSETLTREQGYKILEERTRTR
jgi:hypothetical protein